MAAVTFVHRRLIIMAMLLTACGGRHANLEPSPATPDQTVERFLTAVNASDLETMAMLWGTSRGPEAVVHKFSDADRAQRLTIMQRLLRSETHLITATDASDPSKRV